MSPELNKRQFAFHLIAVAAILIAVAVLTGTFPNTELIAAAFVFSFIWTRVGRAFLLEFAPFLLLLITYKQMRNFADDLTTSDINVTNLIRWEKSLFGGTLPNHWVQTHLWNQPYTPVLDVLTNTLYLSHFLSPLVISVLLWQKRRSMYWAFAIALVVLSYAAFATYVLFPAAPPWWATLYGYLPDQPVTLDHFVTSGEALAKGANPVAAMPSLHTAYPTFIALVSIYVWGKRGIPVILLPLGVGFSIVYLGHHYVIDALAGATYALVVFSTVYLWAVRFTAQHTIFTRQRQTAPGKPPLPRPDTGK
jgi:membrane-associated phospholipid phosphatase